MPIEYIDRVSILTETAATGDLTTVERSRLPCRLAHISGGTASAPDRADIQAMRRMLWGPDYALPSEHVRVRNDATGELWHVVAGSVAAFRLRGRLHHRSCDLVRAGGS